MSRKHYIAIARAINAYRSELDPTVSFDRSRYAGVRQLANILCEVFVEENPRFDRERFLTA